MTTMNTQTETTIEQDQAHIRELEAKIARMTGKARKAEEFNPNHRRVDQGEQVMGYRPDDMRRVFRETHGKPTWIPAVGRYVTPDGATLDTSGMVCHEPPQNEYDRLKLVRAYFRHLLEKATEEFNATKQGLMQQASWATTYANLVPPDAEEAQKVLGMLWLQVLKAKRWLRLTNEALEKTPEAQHRRDQEQEYLDSRARVRQVMGKVASFKPEAVEQEV